MEKRNFVSAFSKAKTPGLDDVLSELNKASSGFNLLSEFTPLNYDSQRAEWERKAWVGLYSDPTFIYRLPDLEKLEKKAKHLAELERELSSASAPTHSLSDLGASPDPERILRLLALETIAKLREKINLATSLALGDDQLTVSLSKQLYGFPSPNEVRRAKLALDRTLSSGPVLGSWSRLTRSCLSAEDIAACFRWGLANYDLSELYRVNVVDDASAIKVSHPTVRRKGTIKIPSGRRVNGLEMKLIFAHELEGHVFDQLNAMTILHGLPRVGQELISEGHATLLEQELWEKHYPYHQNPRLLEKALLLRGVALARSGWDFRRVSWENYEFLFSTRPDLTEEDVVDAAWQLTFRVFRGGYGMNFPLRANYAFPKDHAYFAGYLYINQQFNRGRRRAWLSTGISSRRWLEFLSSRFSLRESDLTWQNRHLSESYEFERLILDLCSKDQD